MLQRLVGPPEGVLCSCRSLFTPGPTVRGGGVYRGLLAPRGIGHGGGEVKGLYVMLIVPAEEGGASCCCGLKGNEFGRTTWNHVHNTFPRGLHTTTNLVTFWTDFGGMSDSEEAENYCPFQLNKWPRPKHDPIYYDLVR